MRRNLVWKTAMAVAVTALAAACGGGTGNAGHTSPPASPAVTGTAGADSVTCQLAGALRTSLDNIVSFKPGSSIAGLRADLGDAQNRLARLKASPDDPWSPQLTALETSLKKLRTEATNPVLTARTAGVTKALADARPKAQSFITAAKAHCPQM
jgi:hypothetical protein